MVHFAAAMSSSRVGSRRPTDDAAAFKLAQALGEDVLAGTRQACTQVGEAFRPKQQLTHHEQRPSLADQIESAGDAAGIAIATRARHGT